MKELKIFGYFIGLFLFGVLVFVLTKGIDKNMVRDNLEWWVIGYFIITRFFVESQISYNFSKFYGDEKDRFWSYIPFYQDTLIFDSMIQLISYWVSLGLSVVLGAVYFWFPAEKIASFGMSLATVASIMSTLGLVLGICILINRLIVGAAHFNAYNDLANREDNSADSKKNAAEGLVGFIIRIILFVPLVRQVGNMFLLNLTSKFSKYKAADLK